MYIPGKGPSSKWDEIPGARGCTPQNIAVDEHVKDFLEHDAVAVGVSTQSIEELSEISSSMKLTQAIL